MIRIIHIKKVITLLLIILFCVNSIYVGYAVEPSINNIIYETSSVENITSGIIHEQITRFTELGWININILEVDLTNPYIKVDNVTDDESMQRPDTALSLAANSGAIAAINASFFYSSGMDENGRDKRNPIGPQIQSGEIVTISDETNSINNDTATFALDNLNRVFYDYWKADISIEAPSGKVFDVKRYNDPHYGYNDLTILDRKYSDTSIGIQSDIYLPDIFEIVVQNGRVIDIREGMEATQIPLNGYVIVTGKEVGKTLKESFKVGDVIELDITTTPNWQNMSMAVSGGCVLVDNGVVQTEFLNTIQSRNPRTAIGTSKDGKKLFLVTVDGRQNESIGMTIQEFADFVSEIGIYNAINLDGGGSTTMVARELGTDELNVVNNPSDGIQRYIPNVVGLFSLAPPAPLEGLIIEMVDQNMFVNTSRDLIVKGYDRFFNPVNINQDEVIWNVSGIDGEFYGNSFIATSTGEGTIEANVNGITAKISITSLDSLQRLSLSSNSITLVNEEQEKVNVVGYDNNGYSALLSYKDIKWQIVGNIGFMADDTFVSTNYGYGYIKAAINNIEAYCEVTVLPKQVINADDFQYANAVYLSYPKNPEGSFTISNDYWHSGGSSGKLTYDFKMGNGTQAVYAVYNNNGILLPEDTIKVGLWVYNSNVSSSRLKLELYDSKNKIYRLDNKIILDWIGWKYVEFPIDNISLPARLTKVYLVQLNSVTESGAIYLDDLNIITANKDLLPQNGQIEQYENYNIEDFESDNASFLSYPYIVTGSYEVADTNSYSGFSAGVLEYSFKHASYSQAAYAVFDNPVYIQEGASSIGVFVNSQNYSDSWIRAEVIDSTGKKQYITLSKGIDWTGWKYISSTLNSLQLPAKITRLYVVNTSPVDETNTLAFDNLSIKKKSTNPYTIDTIPKGTQPADNANREVSYELGEDNYRFAVYAKSSNESDSLGTFLIEKMAQKINAYIESAFLVGNQESNIENLIQKPFLNTSTGYNSFDIKDSRFIQLDTSNNSIRTSVFGQWEWLKQQLNTFTGENIFLFVQNDPNNFTDSLERDFLLKILSHYKKYKYNNVWVFYKGTENSSYLESGVRFISTAGLDVEDLSAFNTIPAQYVLVSVMNDEVTYLFKSID